jgi:hypothetical protein
VSFLQLFSAVDRQRHPIVSANHGSSKLKNRAEAIFPALLQFSHQPLKGMTGAFSAVAFGQTLT